MGFAYEELVTFVVVLMAVVGGMTTVLALWEKLTKFRKPHEDRIHALEEHEQKLMHDYTELEEHETRICALEEDMKEVIAQNRILISALKTLLKHCIDGNDVNALQVEYGILDRYLSGGLKDLEVGHGSAA